VVSRQNFGIFAVLLASTMCGAVGGYSIAHSTGILSMENTQTPKYGTAEDFKLAIKELKDALPRDGGVSTDEADLIIHGESPYHHHDGSGLFIWAIFPSKIWIGVPHSVVIYPESTEDVVKIVKIANKFRMPVVVSRLLFHLAGRPNLILF
jgi:D-lactate dehydrogenase (cytochrome)